MARTVKEKINPHRRPDIEDYLASRSVEYVFEEGVASSEFDVRRSLINQARFEPLNDAVVENYTAAMKRGDKFPAIIASYVGKKLVVVDGNHRLAAYMACGEKIPVYVIDASAETITLMTYEANTKHGLPTTEAERLQHAIWLMDNGATQTKAAEVVGLTIGGIRTAWEKVKADRRAKALDIRDWNLIPAGGRQRLSHLRTDEGFEAASLLAVQAKLSTNEIEDLVGKVNSVRSSSSQVALIEEERDKMKVRIQENASGIIRARGNRQDRTPKGIFQSGAGFLEKHTVTEIAAGYISIAEREEAAKKAKALANKMLALEAILLERDYEGNPVQGH